ncbi:exonuclease domain-containing protein [Tenacibaculum sp. M341]|uniref:exonuclease domain-containing protein n=1 Tax=Tenacibaculum sp. M341 TaxID=2530339 RepID=UPI001053A29C|nr:exonuclease domain-containing protein [Tenacibaculum sp. M341]TCI90997.1 DNA polymerase III subunit epsilon [Tenacibaculum sp. M341]
MKKYAVVDIETNGGVKITEISIFITDGSTVLDEFTTLINPEYSIPPRITSLTGIDNFMVKDAPRFYEVAKKIYQITEDCIFVAHNVNFDYGIIGKEFKSLGLEYRRKKLCTVRLSRKLLPNKRSYSLGKLCASEGINITARHRARGDAEATVILFHKLLNLNYEHETDVFESFLNPRSRQATLPPLLPKEVFDNLSEKHGVYYFWNEDKEIIYVGKANNIKQRVLSHFYDKKKKEINMCMATANITYKETGNELIALLFESAEIKRLYPKFNRAQRRSSESFALFSYKDRRGVRHLAWNSIKMVPNPIMKFYSNSEARGFVQSLCERYELCPKYCHLQTNVSSCFHYQIKKCHGICREAEAIEKYNARVDTAIASLRYENDNFVIYEKGKNNGQIGFILVLNGIYKGFGYMDDTDNINSAKDYLKFIDLQKDNRDIQRILHGYLRKNPENIIHLEPEEFKDDQVISGYGSLFD